MHRLRIVVVAALVALGLAGPGARISAAKDVFLIRDTEIENTIRVYTAPLFNVAGLDAAFVRIHLVQDDRLNAFVAGGQRIFVNTGLLKRADGPGQVIGVMAHEMGHIAGGHLARMQDAIRDAQATSIAALILGIPAAIAAGDPAAMAAARAAGDTIAQRTFLAYTRTMERAADQAAMNYLNEVGMSGQGLLEFLEILQKQSRLYASNLDPYLQSHPLTEDRIEFMRFEVGNSPFTDVPYSDQFVDMHERMRAKLVGYLDPKSQVWTRYPPNDTSTYARYARAIAHMQVAETPEALAEMDSLLEEAPNDPFYWEQRAEILREAGRTEEAIEAYEKAIEVVPWAALIRLNLAQSQLELQDPALLESAIENLRAALRYEPWLSRGWRHLAVAYGRNGELGDSALAMAEASARRGRGKDAIHHAKRAQEMLPQGSAGWMRAQDIQVLLEQRLKDAQK